MILEEIILPLYILYALYILDTHVYSMYMSASRAMASARSKKSGEKPALPSHQYSPDMAPQPAPQQKASGALTIPQAIKMLDQRLQTSENFMHSTSTVVQEIKTFHESATNKYLVDEDVFKNMVERLEKLEAGSVNSSASGISQYESEVTRDLSRPALRRDRLSSSDVTLSDNPKTVADISELKSKLIQLQTYVMKVNERMTDVLFAKTQVPQVSQVSQVPLDIKNLGLMVDVDDGDTTSMVEKVGKSAPKNSSSSSDVAEVSEEVKDEGRSSLKFPVETADPSVPSNVYNSKALHSTLSGVADTTGDSVTSIGDNRINTANKDIHDILKSFPTEIAK